MDANILEEVLSTPSEDLAQLRQAQEVQLLDLVLHFADVLAEIFGVEEFKEHRGIDVFSPPFDIYESNRQIKKIQNPLSLFDGFLHQNAAPFHYFLRFLSAAEE